MEYTAKFLAQLLKGTVDGDQNAKATKFAKIEHGKPGTLSFFANPKYEPYVYTSKASILIVDKSFEPKEPVTPTMVRVENAYSAIADLLRYTSEKKKTRRFYRSPAAVWHPFSTKFGKKVYLGAFSYVGSRTVVGEGTYIHPHVHIDKDVKIGKNCIIYPGVVIYPGTVIGNNVILHAGCIIGSDGFGNAPRPDGSWEKIEHLGNVVIGDDVEIGSNTTVDRAQMESTVIGNGVRIDNLCQIAHNVIVGDHTVMAAQTGIAGSTQIGKYCILAGQVGIAGHLKIADHTTICAQGGVIGNIRKEGEVLVGSPVIPVKQYMKAYAKFKQSGAE
ncbi:MAG: UDP-3-O-(3-hydroxymyristoyl)glucosamine N-acyltransferase [Bacteroidales bacterium]|nr:UDP-3-O-(3-hydroxymyristoyl)glucosamine N-acyltransferase [Bacteroidales bacterium]MBP5676107.1 UDP-3-O-(3-hydroxymyristoyl)glucosamine N-acyltransferase [Bacteroidales bacterium]